jgi:hypothetical protein
MVNDPAAPAPKLLYIGVSNQRNRRSHNAIPTLPSPWHRGGRLNSRSNTRSLQIPNHTGLSGNELHTEVISAGLVTGFGCCDGSPWATRRLDAG